MLENPAIDIKQTNNQSFNHSNSQAIYN